MAKFHEPESKIYVLDADGMIRALLVYAIKSVPKDEYNFGYKALSEIRNCVTWVTTKLLHTQVWWWHEAKSPDPPLDPN